MDVPASPAALSERQELVASFQVRFRRPAGRAALERYMTGLLTEVPNQNGEAIAQAILGTSAQGLQEFLPKMSWDAEDLNRQRVPQMLAAATRGAGAWCATIAACPRRGRARSGSRGRIRAGGGRWATARGR